MFFEIIHVTTYGLVVFEGAHAVARINLNPAWINNYIHSEVWGEITYAFPNFKGAEKRICNFNLHFTGHMVTYPCLD